MNLSDTLAQISPNDDNIHRITIDPTWHQGRTAFGGLSTALAYQAAALSEDDLPPLQSAQIAFAGPVAGDVQIKTQLLRRGRNAAFIKSEIMSGDTVSLSCTFLFVKRRESKIDFIDMPKADFPPIPKDDETRSGPPEFFTYHLDYPDKRLTLGSGEPRLANWHRLRERDGLNPFAELMCIGDALPPSVMGLFEEQAMVSSMNWHINMLTDEPQTENGWWFLDSKTHHASHGASSQDMTVWNSDGKAVMKAMQSVALFI